MKIQVLFVLVLILKSCVCIKLTETFERQTIEDGPYGGSGGSPWTDGGEVHLNGMISSMEFRTGSEVDYVRVQYGGTWASGHGGSGGSPHIFEINPKAKIVIVQGRSGSRLDQIEFITNEGEVFGPFGGSGGGPFVVSHPGCYLSYLSGSA